MAAIAAQIATAGVIFLGGTNFFAYQGRCEARNHIQRLDQMRDQYHSEYTTAFSEAKTDPQRDYLNRRRDEDLRWYSREKARQEEWIARPFYKQLGCAPFPDYANVK